MKTTLGTTQAAHMLLDDENANWSRAGAFALVEWLEDFESSLGNEIDFCPVSIRCDFSEYDSLEDWAMEYFGSDKAAKEKLDCIDQDQDVIEELIRNHIQDYGTLLEFDGGIIVSNF
jgi:hypothetical protein